MVEHVPTDPACTRYLKPVTFTEQQRARRFAGIGCPVCMPTLFDVS